MKTTIPAADVIIFEKMLGTATLESWFSEKYKDFLNYGEKKSGHEWDGSVRLE